MTIPSEIVSALRLARSVGVITGAGMSAPSGVQTYRGRGGLYDDPDQEDDPVIGLTGSTLFRDPEVTWRVLTKLARQARGAVPHAGHFALVRLAQRVPRFHLVTQNVDGLHEQSGLRDVLDIHGSLSATTCLGCRKKGPAPDWERLVGVPICSCGSVLRPQVVLFGEALPAVKVERLYREFVYNPADLLLVIGTTALFPYILDAVRACAEAGNTVVEVNPDPSATTGFASWHLAEDVALVLPELVAAAFPEANDEGGRPAPE